MSQRSQFDAANIQRQFLLQELLGQRVGTKPVENYLLLETGDKIVLEDGSGFVGLEDGT